MADFAVHHEGLPEGAARWVLAVDAATNSVLLCEEDKTFYWKPLAECTLGAVHTPSQPTAVVVQEHAYARLPEPNRVMRRNGLGGY